MAIADPWSLGPFKTMAVKHRRRLQAEGVTAKGGYYSAIIAQEIGTGGGWRIALSNTVAKPSKLPMGRPGQFIPQHVHRSRRLR